VSAHITSRADIERLYEEHGRVLLAYACSFMRSVAEGEDILHQVFARAQREVVVLHVWGDLTFSEIADTLSISANTAASRYRYALGKLREVLKASW
jgi:DNA-directed RNA polymerase specialized sigma24 family protein